MELAIRKKKAPQGPVLPYGGTYSMESPKSHFLAVFFLFICVFSAAAAPPAINPFGQRPEQDREDAKPGYIEMSDGEVIYGMVYLTRDHRLKIYDATLKRQREIPLRVVKAVEMKVKKEWNQKEWRFKELANDEKYFTGRTYPVREYLCTLTLRDDRKITGPLSGLVYIKPGDPDDAKNEGDRRNIEPRRFLLNKRQKGEIGTELKSLIYVKEIKLGEGMIEEGKRKAKRYRPTRKEEVRSE